MRNIIIAIALTLVISSCGNSSDWLAANDVINPGGGLGYLTFVVDWADVGAIRYSLDGEGWIGLPEGEAWHWYQVLGDGVLQVDLTGEHTFVLAANGGEVRLNFIGVL